MIPDKALHVSNHLRAVGFRWSDDVGLTGGWFRVEMDGTTTKLARVGRKYVAVVQSQDGQTVLRQAEGKTRSEALRAL